MHILPLYLWAGPQIKERDSLSLQKTNSVKRGTISLLGTVGTLLLAKQRTDDSKVYRRYQEGFMANITGNEMK